MIRVLLCSLLVGGQIHIERYGLKEVKERGEAIIVGRVESAGPKQVKIKVLRVYGADKPAPGELIEREIYMGIEMMDAHRHVLDSRFRDAITPPPAKGAQIVMVGNTHTEIALLTKDLQRVLDVLFDPARLQKETPARLEADLKLPDLADLAADELTRRGALPAKALLDADPAFLSRRYDAMTPQQKATFLAAILPLTKHDRTRRTIAVRTTVQELTAETIPPAAALVNQLDWKHDHDLLEDHVYLAVIGLKDAPVDLSPFANYLVEASLRRPSHRLTDDDVAPLLERCDQKTRAAIAARFLAAIFTSARATKDEFDGFLLDHAVTLAKGAPSAALWAPLAKLRPLDQRVTSDKEGLLSAMVEIAVALAPLDKNKARDLVEPHLNQGVDLPPEIAKVYQDAIGTLPTKPPAPATLQLRPGEMQRLPSGERVSVKKEDGAVVVIIANADGSGEERLIELADPYREWWLPPYVIIVKRVGGATNLRFTPAAEDPAIDPADAFEIAKKICDKRGATGEVTQDPRDFDGVYVYTAAGPKPCTVRVGLRTRQVLP